MTYRCTVVARPILRRNERNYDVVKFLLKTKTFSFSNTLNSKLCEYSFFIFLFLSFDFVDWRKTGTSITS